MKFKLVLLAVVSVALLATSSASAYITAPPPGTWKSLTQCITQGSITLSQGQYLRVGWGTVSQQQSLDFLDAQNLTLTASGTNGTYAFGWGTGNATLWTQPTQIAVSGKPIWQTTGFVQVNIPTGTYSLSTAGTSVNRAVFDGSDVTKKGQNWFAIPSCTLTVTT
jgi:hypothetical protein